jgi:hypothetical protein
MRARCDRLEFGVGCHQQAPVHFLSRRWVAQKFGGLRAVAGRHLLSRLDGGAVRRDIAVENLER